MRFSFTLYIFLLAQVFATDFNTDVQGERICANENSVCGCNGWVRYGMGNQWSDWHIVDGSIGCNNGVFGDPAPGTEKLCECHHIFDDLPCHGLTDTISSSQCQQWWKNEAKGVWSECVHSDRAKHECALTCCQMVGENPGSDLGDECDWGDVYGRPFENNAKISEEERRRLPVNGGQAGSQEYPWTVLIIRETPLGSLFCGGILISRRWVLSAAHCFGASPGDIDESKYEILFGVKTKDEFAFKRKPTAVFTLSNWDESVLKDFPYGSDNVDWPDIALAQIPPLDCGAMADTRIRPIALRARGKLDGCTAFMAGFGSTENGQVNWVEGLQELNMWARESKGSCPRKFPSHWCLEPNGSDQMERPCTGDSGSGIMLDRDPGDDHQYVVAGINSFGNAIHSRTGVCEPEMDGEKGIAYMTHVTMFKSWIVERAATSVWLDTDTCDEEPHHEGYPRANSCMSLLCFDCELGHKQEHKVGITSLDACKQICIKDKNCFGIDFGKAETSREGECWVNTDLYWNPDGSPWWKRTYDFDAWWKNRMCHHEDKVIYVADHHCSQEYTGKKCYCPGGYVRIGERLTAGAHGGGWSAWEKVPDGEDGMWCDVGYYNRDPLPGSLKRCQCGRDDEHLQQDLDREASSFSMAEMFTQDRNILVDTLAIVGVFSLAYVGVKRVLRKSADYKEIVGNEI